MPVHLPISAGNWETLLQLLQAAFGRVTLPYSASITPDADLGYWQTIIVTDTKPFTINAPKNSPLGLWSEFTLEISNQSGGALGNITWDPIYLDTVQAARPASPANGKKRFVRLAWNGTNWVEIQRAASDY